MGAYAHAVSRAWVKCFKHMVSFEPQQPFEVNIIIPILQDQEHETEVTCPKTHGYWTEGPETQSWHSLNVEHKCGVFKKVTSWLLRQLSQNLTEESRSAEAYSAVYTVSNAKFEKLRSPIFCNLGGTSVIH